MSLLDYVRLPEELQVGRFLESRIQEITYLDGALSSDVKLGKLASQQVPRHMRRRAVSHNPRRLPRRLRDKHKWERVQGGQEGAEVQPKRPSRRYRRRPSNLLAEYNRRQRTVAWLETHLWHAKRFHMEKKWGCQIPYFPNDKSWRASHRATKTKCLLVDLSYYQCIEVRGNTQYSLLEKLEQMTDARTGKTFDCHLEGQREGLALIHHPSTRKVVCEVTFTWFSSPSVPVVEKESSFNRLWIWVHPAFANSFIDVIRLVFNLQEDSADCGEKSAAKTNDNDSTTATDKSGLAGKIKDVNGMKLAPRNVPNTTAPRLRNPEGSCEVVLWRGCLNRFKLIGPLSRSVLQAVCIPATVDMCENNQEMKNVDGDGGYTGLKWWRKFYRSDCQREMLAKQGEMLAKQSKILSGLHTKHDGESLRNFCCTVRDPRLLLPAKKTVLLTETLQSKEKKTPAAKSTISPDNLGTDASDNENRKRKLPNITTDEEPNMKQLKLENVPICEDNGVNSIDFYSLANCTLFCAEVRDAVSLSKCPDAEINSRRAKLPIPGTKLNLGDEESRIPILLLPQSHGIDIILPAGWGMSFWMTLVYSGCRVGGKRELENFLLDSGELPLLGRCLDTPQGVADLEEKAEQLRQKYFSLPPKKRVNYGKEGIAAPFLPPWQQLVQDWLDPAEEKKPSFRILRDKEHLDELARIVSGASSLISRGNIDFRDNPLVKVRITMVGKGTLSPNALICIPSEEDNSALHGDITWDGPMEKLQSDSLEKERKESKKEHQKEKKRLKRKWKKLKDKQVLMKTQASALGLPVNEEKQMAVGRNLQALKELRNTENSKYKETSEGQWIKQDCPNIRKSASRDILGFVMAGQFSYSLGRFAGLGHVTLNGLHQLLESRQGGIASDQMEEREQQNPAGQPKERLVVLVRESSSLKYRLGHLEVVCVSK